MDGTLGSQTAWMLDGSGVQITSGEELGEIVLRGGRGRVPGRRARDRRPREPRGARRVRARRATVWRPLGLRQRIEHAQLLAPEDVPRFAALGVAASVQFSHAPSDRDLADRYWAGQDRRRVRVPLAARTRARSSRTAPTRRSRSSTRSPASAPACGARSTSARPWHPDAGADGAAGVRGDDASRRRGWRATSGGAASCCPGTPQTWSCSTATRGTTSTRRSWRRWSPAGGCTTRRRGTDRRPRRASGTPADVS